MKNIFYLLSLIILSSSLKANYDKSNAPIDCDTATSCHDLETDEHRPIRPGDNPEYMAPHPSKYSEERTHHCSCQPQNKEDNY